MMTSIGLPPTIRACLFDLDGVLTQTARLHAEAWKRTFDEFLSARAARRGQPFVPFDAAGDYEREVDGKSREDGVSSFLRSRGIVIPEGEASDTERAETIVGLAKRKNGFFLSLLREKPVKAYPGSASYVRAVRHAGLRTAVVSSSKNCREVVLSAGLADLFDVRVDGVDAANDHLSGKPAPDTYLAAARALVIVPAAAAIFEDALAGVEAGRAGHFGYVVGVERTGRIEHAEALARAGADVVVRDLSALFATPAATSAPAASSVPAAPGPTP